MRGVVVTGTSTGIGWGTTKVLSARGFRVFGSVRKKADAQCTGWRTTTAPRVVSGARVCR
jgi:NAD(P)-dependent dehydrogenase (short-subunit alcohol dehydrogenase family)